MNIIEAIAKEYGEAPATVRSEMEAALKASGIDVDVETFIRWSQAR